MCYHKFYLKKLDLNTGKLLIRNKNMIILVYLEKKPYLTFLQGEKYLIYLFWLIISHTPVTLLFSLKYIYNYDTLKLADSLFPLSGLAISKGPKYLLGPMYQTNIEKPFHPLDQSRCKLSLPFVIHFFQCEFWEGGSKSMFSLSWGWSFSLLSLPFGL